MDRFLQCLHCCKQEDILHRYEKCPPHLNIVLTLLCENETSHFIVFNALLEHHLLHQAWCATWSYQLQRKQTKSHKVCSKCPPKNRLNSRSFAVVLLLHTCMFTAIANDINYMSAACLIVYKQ